jgi:tRNA(Ile)-lysidine synthase
LTESESGKFIQSSLTPIRIIKFRHWLIVTSSVPSQSDTIVIEEETKNVQFEIANLKFEIIDISNFKLQTSNSIACLDANEVQFPFILRNWKQGDYFYPLGMKKKKKLARFFIDQKFSKPEKIIWVVGHRIDDRFKVTEKTKKILTISLSHP